MGDRGRVRGWSRRSVVRPWVAMLLAVGLTGGLLPASPAGAHGTPDQSSDQTPGQACSAATYPGAKLLTVGESRQSFVPSRGGLAAVDLCISNLVGIVGTDFTLKIYEGDNPAVPGALLAAQPHDAGTAILSAEWVHVDLPVEVPTTPGAGYIIGLEPAAGVLSSVTFQWRATCDGLLAACSPETNTYPQGRTSDLDGNADYGFRTSPLHDADLVGAVTVGPLVCPGLDLAGRATGSVTNNSLTAVGPFATEWLWSTDATVDPLDRVLGDPTTVPGLGAGATAAIPPPVLPPDLPLGEGHLLLHLDINDQVVEINDLNNVAAGPTTVTACGQPAITDLTLAVDETQALTGFNQTQFADLDPAALATLPQTTAEAEANPSFSQNGFSQNGFSPNGFSENGFSQNGFSPNGLSPNGFSPNGFSPNGFSADEFSPNGFSPNGFSPNGFSPNGFSAVAGLSLQTVLADVPRDRLQMPAVQVPITEPGWQERLGATTEPIQEITFAEAIDALPDLTAGEVDLRAVLNVSALGLALAGSPLTDVATAAEVCDTVATYGTTCAALGFDPASMSLLALESRFATAFQLPIADRALPASGLASALVRQIRLASTEPFDFLRFNFEHTRLGQVPVAEAMTDPELVADCTAVDCDAPFADLARTGALRDVTMGVVLDGLAPAGRAAATVGDLGLGLLADNDLRLSSANWNLANPFLIDPSCPPVTYHLTGANSGDGAAVEPTATVTLPAGFVFVPGTATIAHDGQAPEPQADPAGATAADGSRTYTFELDGTFATSFDLAFQACAGVYLGHVPAGTSTIAGVGIDGPYQATTQGSVADVVEVVERTPGVTTVSLVPPEDPDRDNIVVADHISETNAHDLWTVPVTGERRMYIVRLFPPIGIDLDLLAFGSATSAAGFSQNGFSPNGFSPNGFSPNGFSPNGFSPNGFSPNGFSPNGFSPNGFSTTGAPDLNDDLPVDELRPPGSHGTAVSANRGDGTETLFLFTDPGDEGELTLAVTDYLGRSTGPYFLTVQSVRPALDPRLAQCQAAPWTLDQPAGSPPPAWTGAEPPRTVFVTNRQVAASAYGATATQAGIDALHELAARPEIRGIVLEADHDPDVRAAYATWHDDWCNPAAANRVGTQVRSLLLDLRAQYPTIDTIVLAGDDAVVPDFRLRDGSAVFNEDHYLDALLNATGGNNALVAAYANGAIPSADPYGNDGVLPFGSSFAFPPSAGVSRLVEGPMDWVAQKDQYVAADGLLDPAAGFVSGFRGNVDGARAAAEVLDGVLDRPPTVVLDDEAGSWTAADFRQGAFTAAPDIAGYNAHGNHFALLSDAGSDNGTNDLVTTAESALIPFGGTVFSNACHLGTAVADILNRTPSAFESERLLDWNQALTGGGPGQARGIAVTNSGFGIFDTDIVGQGERLQTLFLEELTTAPNASLALARAKNRFFATAGVYDPYTFKTLQQLSMYGLGIFMMEGASRTEPPVVRPPDADSIDISVGPYAVSPVGTAPGYQLEASPSGTRVDLVDGSVEASHTAVPGYWSTPISSQTVVLPEGRASAGVWITGVESVELAGFDPVLTTLGVSNADRLAEPQLAGPFPTAPAMVNDVGPAAVATLMHGLSVPTGLVDGQVVADVFLHTRIDAEILLRDAVAEPAGCNPHVDRVTVSETEDGSLALIDVVATSDHCDTAVGRVAALVRDDTGVTTYRELTQGPNGHWTGAVAFGPGASEVKDLLTEAFNGVGVGYHRFKGDEPTVRIVPPPRPGVEVTIVGNQHPTGVYLGPVQGTVATGAGVTCTVYDNDRVVAEIGDDQSFTISGDGVHEVGVDCSNGGRFEVVLAIDGSTPTIVWPSPAAGTTVAAGEELVMLFSCPDTGTGATCTGLNDGLPIESGDLVDTSTTGTHTVSVTATDAVGHTTSASRTYTVTSPYVFSPFFSPIKAKPQINNVSPGSILPVKFNVTSPSGVPYTDPAIIAERLWVPINCSTKAPTGASFPATGTTPEYTSEFHFNVDVPRTIGCYELVVVLDDGTSQSAYFKVKGSAS